MSSSARSSIPRACRLQFSLRTLFLVTTAASMVLAWQAHRAEQQASAIAALEKMGAKIETPLRSPKWLWRLLGGRFAHTADQVDMSVESVEKIASAVPHLKALPSLRSVHLHVHWGDRMVTREYYGDRRAALESAESLVTEALPNVKVRSFVSLITPVIEKIVIVPEEEPPLEPTPDERPGAAAPDQAAG